VLVGDARFLQGSTFYGRHGDILPYAALLITLVAVLLAWPGRRVPGRRSSPGSPASEGG